MKTLIVMRHAKSSWKDATVADHDRPLNKRGKAAAPQMAKLLSEKGLRPDLIVSSSARRARQTADRAIECGAFDCPVELRDEAYLADPQELVELLRQTPDDHERVMLIGHNPGLEGLVHGLTGVTAALPTAAAAHIELDIGAWSELSPGLGRLAACYCPNS